MVESRRSAAAQPPGVCRLTGFQASSSCTACTGTSRLTARCHSHQQDEDRVVSTVVGLQRLLLLLQDGGRRHCWGNLLSIRLASGRLCRLGGSGFPLIRIGFKIPGRMSYLNVRISSSMESGAPLLVLVRRRRGMG